MHIRISGLVKFFNRVKEQLKTGFPPSQVAAYRERIRRVIGEVERICREHHGTPDDLPAPSRNAYYALKNLDLENLPVAGNTAAAAPASAAIGVKNVVCINDYYITHFWSHATELLASRKKRALLRKEMQEHVAAIEQICARKNATPARLTRPAQQVYCWLKFLCDDENFCTHLRALVTGQQLLRQIAPEGTCLPFEIHLHNMRFIYRVKNYSDGVVLKCNEGLIAADAAVWREVLVTALQGKRRGGRLTALDEFLDSEDFSGVLFEMESAIEPVAAHTQGQVHDLAASFDRVNRRYFNGKMERPRMHWNRALTVGKMGHYHHARDTVMLSLTLDQPEVPPFVVDYVMYHELLHKKHGVRRINGRRYAHTPEFRAEERRFEQYHAAVAFLNKLSLRQRGHAVELPGSAPAAFPERGQNEPTIPPACRGTKKSRKQKYKRRKKKRR